MTPNGMTKDDWKQFTDLKTKANNGQIHVMAEELQKEMEKRLKQFVEEKNNE